MGDRAFIEITPKARPALLLRCARIQPAQCTPAALPLGVLPPVCHSPAQAACALAPPPPCCVQIRNSCKTTGLRRVDPAQCKVLFKTCGTMEDMVYCPPSLAAMHEVRPALLRRA